jgi:hypothetical protein
MEGSFSTGQIPQWAVVPMEEEEVSILRFSMFVEKKFLL